MKNRKKFLLINFGGIGDEILFLPVVSSLKKEFPDCFISLILEPRSTGIKFLTKKIDKFIPINIKSKNKYFELLKLLFEAWCGCYDVIISSGSNKFIALLLFLTGIKEKIGYDSGILSKKLLTHTVKLNKNQYAVNMYHDLIKPLTKYEPNLPELDVKKSDKIFDFVLIHPGVSKLSIEKGITKTITPELWAEVIKGLINEGRNVKLVGGPDDEECIKKICSLCKDVNFENLYGKTQNLRDLAELISSADKFVCSDSAPMHIGIAMGVKTYAIFGPTDDKKLVSPEVIVIKTNDNCPIKPCLWEKRQTSCENPICLKFDPKDIVKQILLK